MTQFIDNMPADFQLSSEHIDVWMIHTSLSKETFDLFDQCISQPERQRIAGLRIHAKRDEALIARGLLRLILGRILKQHPPAIELSIGPFGKPCLAAGSLHTGVHFNLSHTSGRVLLAATLHREVGVDDERIRLKMAHEELARRFFSANEYAAIAAFPVEGRPRAFFTTWCRKEAILKTTGQGIAAGLNTFDVPVTPTSHPITVSRRDSAGEITWTLHDLQLEEPYLACVASEACDATLRTWRADHISPTFLTD